MRVEEVIGRDLIEIARHDPSAVREGLAELHPADVAEIVKVVPREDRVRELEQLDEKVRAWSRATASTRCRWSSRPGTSWASSPSRTWWTCCGARDRDRPPPGRRRRGIEAIDLILSAVL